MAITPEDVISWGGNSYGQCGQGERAEVLSVKPRSIKPLQGISIPQVVCGRYHTLCVTATSQVCTSDLSSAYLSSSMLSFCRAACGATREAITGKGKAVKSLT